MTVEIDGPHGRRQTTARPGADLDLLDVDGLAALLDVPKATVYAWSTSGQGPDRIRVGRHIRYRRSDVARWLDARRITAGSAAYGSSRGAA